MASLPPVMLWRSMLCVSEAPQPGSGGERPGSSELPCTTFKPRACQTCALVSTCSTVQATSSRPQLAVYHRHWLHGQRTSGSHRNSLGRQNKNWGLVIRLTQAWKFYPRMPSSAFSPHYNSCCCVGGSLQVKPAEAELGRSSQPQTLQLIVNFPISKSWGNSTK